MAVLSLACLCVASLSLGGCVSLSAGEEMQQDIEAMRAEQRAMQENYDEEKERLTAMIDSARQDVDQLQSVLKEARALLQRNNADLGVEIQNTREELKKLHGETEELNFKFRRMEQELEIFKEDVDLRFEEVEGRVDLPEQAMPLYEHGVEALQDGRISEARRALGKFLEEYSSHGKAADARYQLAESHLREEQWETAIGEYRQVLQDHPNSPRVGDATYRIGQSLMNIGRCEQANQWFELVTDDYGNSQFASDARQRMSEIKSGKCP